MHFPATEFSADKEFALGQGITPVKERLGTVAE